MSARDVPPLLRVAYLINQYPKVSHSFIRREIEALEGLGVPVVRYALRGWDSPLADGADERERVRTRYVLRCGLAGLLRALTYWALRSPLRLLSAAIAAWRLGGRGAPRPAWVHLAYWLEACTVARWVRSDGVGHLHAHFGTNAAEVALLAYRLCGVRYSFTVHGPEEFDQPVALRLAQKAHDAAFVVAISAYGRSQLLRWLAPNLWSKVQVVHCGLQVADFEAPLPLPAARRLVCVGRLCEQKGQLLLLQAASRLLREGLDFELVLAGDGEMRDAIEAEVRALGLERNVRITGWLSGDEVRRLLDAARALVLPSFAEGLPVVLMEAMARARPVITTYVAGIPELVQHGRHGWLVPAGDVEPLTEAMRECLEATPETLTTMGRAAQQRCAERHSIDIQAAVLAGLMHGAASACASLAGSGGSQR